MGLPCQDKAAGGKERWESQGQGCTRLWAFTWANGCLSELLLVGYKLLNEHLLFSILLVPIFKNITTVPSLLGLAGLEGDPCHGRPPRGSGSPVCAKPDVSTKGLPLDHPSAIIASVQFIFLSGEGEGDEEGN